jgi:hypothetical protein
MSEALQRVAAFAFAAAAAIGSSGACHKLLALHALLILLVP